MEVKHLNQGEVRVIAPCGRLDSMTAPHFEAELMRHITESTAGVVVDFAEISYISSAGLRVLLIAAKKMKASARKLALSTLNESIKEVFTISGFLPIFITTATRQEALDALKG